MIIRLLFLVLVLLNVNIFAQNQTSLSEQNKPQAYKFDEYVKIAKSEVQESFDKLDERLVKNEIWDSGIVVNFAPTEAKIKLRERIVRNNWRRVCRNIDMPRLTFISVKSENEKTELWIVPVGADLPEFNIDR